MDNVTIINILLLDGNAIKSLSNVLWERLSFRQMLSPYASMVSLLPRDYSFIGPSTFGIFHYIFLQLWKDSLTEVIFTDGPKTIWVLKHFEDQVISSSL